MYTWLKIEFPIGHHGKTVLFHLLKIDHTQSKNQILPEYVGDSVLFYVPDDDDQAVRSKNSWTQTLLPNLTVSIPCAAGNSPGLWNINLFVHHMDERLV